jgi:hypothetical protein
MSRNTGIFISLIVIAVIASGAGYFYYMNQLEIAVSDLEIVFDSVELKSIRLFPSPEANLTLTYVANNTHSMEFMLTLNGELHYGSSFITPLKVKDAHIQASRVSTIQMDVSITGSILDTFDPMEKSEYILQGDLVAETLVFGFIPVEVSKPLSDYQLGQN